MSIDWLSDKHYNRTNMELRPVIESLSDFSTSILLQSNQYGIETQEPRSISSCFFEVLQSNQYGIETNYFNLLDFIHYCITIEPIWN